MGKGARGIGRLFVLSYRDSVRLIGHLWPAILFAAVVYEASFWVTALLATFVLTDLGRVLTKTIVFVGATWIVAPYIVAQYRFVLTGEVVRWPEDIRRSASTRLVFGWSAVMAFVGLPFILAAALVRPLSGHAPVALPLVVVLLVGIVCFVFGVRVITLLPAASLGVPISLPRAFRETKGRFWFVLGAALLPPASVILPMTLLAAGTNSPVISQIVGRAAATFGGLLVLSVTSRLYQMLGMDTRSGLTNVTAVAP